MTNLEERNTRYFKPMATQVDPAILIARSDKAAYTTSLIDSLAQESQMSLTMYAITVPPIVRSLTQLRQILEKASEYAEAKKIDPSVLVNARLFPDMYPLKR